LLLRRSALAMAASACAIRMVGFLFRSSVVPSLRISGCRSSGVASGLSAIGWPSSA